MYNILNNVRVNNQSLDIKLQIKKTLDTCVVQTGVFHGFPKSLQANSSLRFASNSLITSSP
jgi:hypothetical protein